MQNVIKKGGYVDGNMKNFELANTKEIRNLLKKYKMNRNELLPSVDFTIGYGDKIDAR